MMEVAATLMFPLVVESMATGVSPKPRGNRGFTGSPGSDTFKTQDGWIAVGANTPLQFEALCRTIGLPNLMEDPALIQSGETSGSFVQAADAQYVRSLIEKAFLEDASEHWERILNSAHVPAARLRDLVELGKDLAETRPSAIVTLPPTIGHSAGMKTLSMSSEFVGTKTNMTCPQLGENTLAVLKQAGLEDSEIAALNRERVIFLTP